MRRIVRTLLLNVGVKEVYEASDGVAGLEAIRTIGPDIVILDWELPLLNGAELVRIVRSPDVFPMPPRADHHAECPWRTLARGRGVADRRQRVSGETRLRQIAVRSHGLDPRQAASDRTGRRLLRAGTTRGTFERSAAAKPVFAPAPDGEPIN